MRCEHEYKLTKSKKNKPYYLCIKCGANKTVCSHEYKIEGAGDRGIKRCLLCNHIKQLPGYKEKTKVIDINTVNKKKFGAAERVEYSRFSLSKHCMMRAHQRKITVDNIRMAILNGTLVLLASAEFFSYVFDGLVVSVDPIQKTIKTCYRKLT